MSATVAAALKKIAVSILTNPKILKKVLCIVLVLVVALATPLLAVYAALTGKVEVDIDGIAENYVENLNDAQVRELQKMNDTMLAVESALNEAELGGHYREAQVLYALGLFDFSDNENFASDLASCFKDDLSDAELVELVNTKFGSQIDAEEYSTVVKDIRSTYIDSLGFTNNGYKNNIDLCVWAEEAVANGWGYVYGTYGTVLTQKILDIKAKQYPDEVGGKYDFIKSNWLGGRTADCVGLIKGYSWLDEATGQINYGTNGMPDIGADGMYSAATEKGTIDTIPEIPGVAVWHNGHIGIYIGDGYVIQAANTKKGVIKTPLSYNSWTHWLKIPYITYIEEETTSEPTTEIL